MSIDERTREELGALLDGELPAEQAAALLARIERDDALRAEFEALRRVAAAVRDLPRAAAPAALRGRVAAGISPARPVRRGWGRWGLAAAAVLGVATTAGFFALRNGDARREHEYHAREDAARPEDDRPAARTSGPAGADPRRGDAVRAEAGELDDAEEHEAAEPAPDRPGPAPAARAPDPAVDADRPDGGRVGKAAGTEARDRLETKRDDERLSRLALATEVERGLRPAGERRRQYLAHVATLPRDELVLHLNALGAIRASLQAKSTVRKEAKGHAKQPTEAPSKGAAPGGGSGAGADTGAGTGAGTADDGGGSAVDEAGLRGASGAVAVLEMHAGDRAEAQAIRHLLKLAYAGRAVRARPQASLEVQGVREFDFALELTEAQRIQVARWLARLDLAPAAPASPRREAARSTFAEAAAEHPDARATVHIRVHFAEPPK